ncbi:WhiB family transcriptional regulator [Streptosporangium sp. NBC_01755]|uniref:WhiB family transcriptional regulator n=1 Tax=Streptosporangium sp. NBC_01755 TaxID=2975949 RepID=UPI002DD864AE|nr:WhiB family transcriptional regulator [Streptosporangium sp. NBC_01755]WSD01405.1 WhiB family transcriptional regulator [Streptosporangium sp. NBC_01755]
MTPRLWPPRQYDDPISVPGWQERGRCGEIGDPELWFPEKGGPTREGKQVCRGCEVRSQCLEYALENHERFGIWGGLSERERRRILAQRARYGAAA